MNETQKCPRCGSELSSGSPYGLCPKCLLRQGFEQTEQVSEEIEESGRSSPGVLTGREAGQSLLAPRIRYIGDYELLEEIARGGMGVVYKARQVTLNRIVAIKMILSGQLATEAQVRRFRTEAEAAANLQHPHIVAIHEVGEHDGQPYFSMDYIEGKNLAEWIDGHPLPAIQAARWLKTVAEAVHFAHQRGTLHRDLKPHNILIDSAGQPRVTDFGLAKNVAEESHLTRSGSVLGSPSYMPPEQASGRQAEIGPASDVYSLGAVFFAMLTGRAPFQAETSLATLEQVMHEDPPSLARLNSAVPPDLATICMKCLEKRPERRYATARALAEELERFLNQEPIWARPPSWLRRVWSWSLRHPWALTGAASIAVLGLVGIAYGLWEQNRFLVWSQGRGVAAGVPGREPMREAIKEWLWPLILVAITLPASLFADLVDRKRRGLSLRAYHYWIYGSLGVAEMLAAVGLALACIHGYVWREFRGFGLLGFMSFVVLILAWFGSLLVWYLLRQIHQDTFASENEEDAVLFPRRPSESFSTVGQRRDLNRYYLAFVLIVGASLLPESNWQNRFGFTLSAILAAGAVLCTIHYRRTQSADRHLLFLGALSCMLCLLPFGVFQELPRTGLPVERLTALGLGLTCGILLARFTGKAHQQEGDELPETANLEWVGANSGILGAAVGLVFIILVGSARWVFPLPPEELHQFMTMPFLTYLCFFQPYELTCWRRARGPERRGRAWTLAISWTLILMLWWTDQFGYARRAVGLGLGLGVLAVMLVMWAGRRGAPAKKPKLFLHRP